MIGMRTTAPYKIQRIEEEIPLTGPDQVLVRMLQVGVCGSDIQIYHGLHQYAKLPLIMGHECVGVVEETGESVKNVKRGERVTIQPQIFCGACYPCLHGNPNICEHLSFMGVHQDGFFREYVPTPAWNVIPVLQNLALDGAVLAEPVAVAVNAVRKAGIVPGMKVAVIGAGTIGNLVAQVCRRKGAETLLTDVLDHRLEIGKQVGADHVKNTGNTSLKEVFRQVFADQGPDAILDCAGIPAVLKEIMDSAQRGTRIAVVANYKQPVELDLCCLQRRELKVHGVMQYIRQDFEEAVALLEKGVICFDKVVTDHFPIESLQDAFSYIDENAGKTLKTVITFGRV